MNHNDPLIHEVLINHIHSGMKTLYKESYKLNKNDPIIVFQVALSKIKDISQISLEDEYERLLKRVEEHGNDEEFIDRMIELICRNTVKYIMEVQKGYFIENIQEIPYEYLNISSNKYKMLHLFTLESARGIWPKANLYCDKYPEKEYEKNMEDAKKIIKNCIVSAINKRIDVNELYDYYTQPKEPEEQSIDYRDFISRNNVYDIEERQIGKGREEAAVEAEESEEEGEEERGERGDVEAEEEAKANDEREAEEESEEELEEEDNDERTEERTEERVGEEDEEEHEEEDEEQEEDEEEESDSDNYSDSEHDKNKYTDYYKKITETLDDEGKKNKEKHTIENLNSEYKFINIRNDEESDEDSTDSDYDKHNSKHDNSDDEITVNNVVKDEDDVKHFSIKIKKSKQERKNKKEGDFNENVDISDILNELKD